MKKLVLLLAVMTLVLGVSANAMAYFAAGDLVQVVYQNGGTGNEVLTDLTNGSISTWTTSASVPTTNYNTGITTSSLSSLLPGSTWSSLDVAYFTYKGSGAFWLSGTQGGQTNNGSQKAGTDGALGNVINLAYANSGNGASSQVTQASGSSGNTYWGSANKNGLSVGTFAGFVNTGNGEQNLAALASGGSVSLYLYYYPSGTSNTAGSGVSVAKLTINNNGTTSITANSNGGGGPTTPIPAPVVLLGSGLLGLVGLKRRLTL